MRAVKFILKKKFKIYVDAPKNISVNVSNNFLDGSIINVPTSSEVRSLISGIQRMNFRRNK